MSFQLGSSFLGSSTVVIDNGCYPQAGFLDPNYYPVVYHRYFIANIIHQSTDKAFLHKHI